MADDDVYGTFVDKDEAQQQDSQQPIVVIQNKPSYGGWIFALILIMALGLIVWYAVQSYQEATGWWKFWEAM